MNTFKKVDLEDIHIFCKTAECSSFTEAAILIGTTPPSISKAIARLEKKLSLKLFIRSTRAMRLTEEGLRYYDVCKTAIENIQHVESELTNSEQPHGVLKLTMPDSYGMTVLIPRIQPFFEKYKDSLKMEISLGNQFVNFTKEAFDLAIRIGDLKDDRVVAKYLHDTGFKLIASPEYLKIHGMPKSIEELHNHQCIGLKFPELSVPLPWEFGKNNQFLPIDFDIVHSHSLGALDHAKLGLGIARLLDFSVQKELDEGSLIEVLPNSGPPALKVHLVYPSGFYLPSRIQLFMDYFQKEILPHL
ncbi:LysR family transcriptional regulator [Ignatzschineria sp. LJL83]